MLNSIIAMAVCVLLSAYFSASETAFSALNKMRIQAMAEHGNRRAALTLRLSENYDKLITTILIGNNIVNIATASLGTVLFIGLLQNEELGTTVSTAVVTLVVLIFGEITPKSIAKDHAERVAMFSAPLLHGMITLFTPLNFLFSKWKQLVGKLFRIKGNAKMSQEELLLLLDSVEQEGAIDDSESKLLRSAVEFGDVWAQDILTPRIDLVGIPVDAEKETMTRLFDQCSFSRLPVYDTSIDKIIGIVHRTDFYTHGGVTAKDLREIMTQPLFVPGTEKIDDLLQKLRTANSHLAVVVDEYGGTLGIVTMEDILEELVGEIWDEHDVVREPVQQLEEHVYQVDGGWSMDDFCEKFDIQTESQAVSVGGWAMEMLGRIPKKGDCFPYDHLEISISHTAEHRVESIRVTVLPEQISES